MTLNDLLARAQKGTRTPRNSERIRTGEWLTIDGEGVPVYDMSDANLLGSIKGVLSTLPTRFLMEWNDTLKKLSIAADQSITEEQILEAYRDWLNMQWHKYVPEMVITMAEEAADRGLPFKLGEGIYAQKTAEFLRDLLGDKVAEAKTDAQIKTLELVEDPDG